MRLWSPLLSLFPPTVLRLLFASLTLATASGADSATPWWTWRNPLPQGDQFTDVAFADGTYVAVGRGGTIFTSTDAVTWVSRTSGVGDAIGFVVHGDGLWMATAGERILTSADGATWFVSPNTFDVGAFGHAVFFGGRLLASDWRGRIWFSTDGAQWDIAYAKDGAYFTGIAAGGGRVIAVGNLSGRVCAVTSTDGSNWTDASVAFAGIVPESFGGKPIVYVNNRWFLLGSETKTSLDGQTWTTLNTGFRANDISFNGGRYVVAGELGNVFISSDLSSWTSVTLPVLGSAREARAVTYGRSEFVVVGAGGTIATSPDGNIWVNRTNNRVPDNLRRIAYADGRWLVAGENGVYSSPDGVAWNPAALFPWGTTPPSVAFGAGIVLASGGGTPLLRSIDHGVTWAPVTAPPGSFDELAFGDGRFVGVFGGRRLASSTDGIAWTEAPELPINAATHFDRVVSQGGRWIAQGNRWDATKGQDIPVLAASSDGLNWTRLPEDTFPGRSYAIAAGAGMFVSIPSVGITPTIFTSTDGLIWKQIGTLANDGGPVMALGYTGDGFVGMTAFGHTIFSCDGLAWTKKASTGDFIFNDVVAGGGSILVVGNNSVILQSGTGRFANNSTRALTANTEEVLIAGFVLTGSEPTKRVLIRGIGPSLADYAVTGALQDPQLVLYRGQSVVASNTDWRNSPDSAAIAAAGTRVGAFALRDDRADSALLLDLPPGIYTAHVRSAGTGHGVALAEVYEVGQTKSRLINISTRASVGTGSSVVIPGMVIAGDRPKRVLLRAVGPTLRQYGVNAALARPTMSLKLGSRTIASNTEWDTAPNAAEITATAARVGAFPLVAGSRDAALLVTLNPGIYTTVVEGVGGTSGVALVEVYEVE